MDCLLEYGFVLEESGAERKSFHGHFATYERRLRNVSCERKKNQRQLVKPLDLLASFNTSMADLNSSLKRNAMKPCTFQSYVVLTMSNKLFTHSYPKTIGSFLFKFHKTTNVSFKNNKFTAIAFSHQNIQRFPFADSLTRNI